MISCNMLDFGLNLLVFSIPALIPIAKEAMNKTEYSEARKIVKANRKLDKEEVKKVVKLDPTPLSEDILNSIRRASNGVAISEIIFTNYAVKTDKMIKYAFHYMTNDKARLLGNVRKETREFINGISVLAGFGKIFKDDRVVDIKKYDVVGKDSIEHEYIIDYEALVDKLKDEEFQSKWKARLGRSMIKYNPNQIGTSNEYINPIFFNEDGSIYQPKPKKGIGITDEQFIKFENAFAKFFDADDDYYYECIDNVYYLVIIRKEAMYVGDKYIIDDGRILGGNKVAILGRYIDDNGRKDIIFVKVDNHPDIIKNIIKTAFYNMSHFEVMSAVADMFNNGTIYAIVDMANTPWMDNMFSMDRLKLEFNLNTIFKLLNVNERYKFEYFIDPANFALRTAGAVQYKILDTQMAPLSNDDIMITLSNNYEVIKSVNGVVQNRFDLRIMMPVS